MRKLLLLLPLLLTGCHKGAVALHPGAISHLDSYAYDVLLVEQDAINNAKAQYLQGKLPPEAKEPLNYAIDQYDIAQAAWQSYHAGGKNQDALSAALEAMVAAVGALEKALQKPLPNGPLTPATQLYIGGVTWA